MIEIKKMLKLKFGVNGILNFIFEKWINQKETHIIHIQNDKC